MTQDEIIKKCARFAYESHAGLRHIESAEDMEFYLKARFDLEKPKEAVMGEEPMQNRILRMMAWERAKGEMNAMLSTYFNNYEKWDEFRKAMANFINTVEDKGMYS